MIQYILEALCDLVFYIDVFFPSVPENERQKVSS